MSSPTDHSLDVKLNKLTDINREIAGCLDESEVLRRSLDLETEIVDAVTGSILLMDESGDHLNFAVSLGEYESVLKDHRIEVGEGIAGTVAETGEPVLIEDTDEDERFAEYFDERTGFETKTLLCAPIQTGDKVLGVAEVINKSDDTAFDREDLLLFSAFAGQVAVALENARLHEEVLSRQQMIQEARTARKVQESYLPDRLPSAGNITFAGRLASARRVSGDFYESFWIPGGKTVAVIGDVSGKGMPAAMYMCRVLTELRTRLKYGLGTGEVLESLNDRLHETSTEGMFVTLILFVLDPESRRVEVGNAGHLPYFRLQAGDVKRVEQGDNPPLGIQPDRTFSTNTIDLGPEESIVTVTDGFTEAQAPDGTLFELQGVQRALDSTRLPADLIVPKLFRDVEHYVDTNDPGDDLTALVFGPADIDTPYVFELAASSEYLSFLRETLRKRLSGLNLGDETRDNLVVGLEEAVNNIIEHTYHHRKTGRIAVTLNIEDTTLTVTLRDFGEPVTEEELRKAPPESDGANQGGYGLRLIRNIYDSVDHDPLEDGNRLILRKDLTDHD